MSLRWSFFMARGYASTGRGQAKVAFEAKGAAALTHNQNALSTSAEVVIAANSARVYAEITNHDVAINVFLGKDSSLTTSNGYLLAPGKAFGFARYTGPVWAIAASGTPTVSFIEW
jgi:hypothetical protein